MDFDEVLVFLGDFGPYQRRLFLINAAILFTVPFITFGQIFMSADVAYACQTNMHYGDQQNGTSFETVATSQSECYFFVYRQDDRPIGAKSFMNSSHMQLYINDTLPRNSSGAVHRQCSSWTYDLTQYKSTTVTEWDLVCDRKWLRELAQSAVYAGMVIGCIVFGSISDRYGRWMSISSCLLLQSVFCFISAVSPYLAMYIVCQFAIGCTYPGVFLAPFAYVLEWTGHSKRSAVGNLLALMYVCGHMIFALLAYFIRHWRILQVAIALPQVVLLVVYMFRVVPESPRWLLTQGHMQEADVIIRKAVRMNRATLPNSYFVFTRTFSNNLERRSCDRKQENLSMARSAEKHSLADLFKTTKLRNVTLIICVNGFAMTMCYFGLSIFSTSLAGDPYVNFFLSGVVEVPSILVCAYIINRWGRTRPIAIFNIVSGVSCFICPFPPADWQYLSTAFGMIGKLGAAAAFWSIYIYEAELFPTAINNMAIGFNILIARVSASVIPFTRLLTDIWPPFPYVIIGTLTAISGTFFLIAPETLNRPLPATVEEFEEMHGNGKRSAVTGKGCTDVISRKLEYSLKELDVDVECYL
ncbi:organic cation transporter protein-like [Ptychodera flava]|uniref:organic cation transporter protein-like n=1 Tax=Ptychodera flava TaxID=63121 RepID=UPI00396A8CF4